MSVWKSTSYRCTFMQLLYYSPLEVVFLDAAAATLQYIGVCRQSKLKTQWGLQICNIVLTVHLWSDGSFSNNHILYYSVTVYCPIYISMDMLSRRDMRKGTITPRQIFINTPAAGHFFVCLVVNEKQFEVSSRKKKKFVYFCWGDPTRNLFALLIRIIVNRDNLKKKKKKRKKRGFLRQLWDLVTSVAFVFVRGTKHHDVCSLWYLLLLMKYVLFISFGSDYNNEMRWEVMGGSSKWEEIGFPNRDIFINECL